MQKIIAQKQGRQVYLVQVDDKNGRVLDVPRRTYFDPLPYDSIFARGYWYPPDPDAPAVSDLLQQIGAS